MKNTSRDKDNFKGRWLAFFTFMQLCLTLRLINKLNFKHQPELTVYHNYYLREKTRTKTPSVIIDIITA